MHNAIHWWGWAERSYRLRKKKGHKRFFHNFLKLFWMFLNIFLNFFPKTTSRRQRQWKERKNGAKTVQNGPKTIQNGSKNENENFWNNMHFYEVFEKLRNNRALHISPRWSKKVRKKTRKNKVCLKWKISSWRSKRVQDHQNRSYPRGVNVRSKFLFFGLFFFHRG